MLKEIKAMLDSKDLSEDEHRAEKEKIQKKLMMCCRLLMNSAGKKRKNYYLFD